MWNIETVRKKLKENPMFIDVINGNADKLFCKYDINGIDVILFNTIGGIEIWLLNVPKLAEQIEDIQEFAKLTQIICKDLLKHHHEK